MQCAILAHSHAIGNRKRQGNVKRIWKGEMYKKVSE
jgi:hypothetical protein